MGWLRTRRSAVRVSPGAPQQIIIIQLFAEGFGPWCLVRLVRGMPITIPASSLSSSCYGLDRCPVAGDEHIGVARDECDEHSTWRPSYRCCQIFRVRICLKKIRLVRSFRSQRRMQNQSLRTSISWLIRIGIKIYISIV